MRGSITSGSAGPPEPVRRVTRRAVPIVFVVALVVAAFLTLPWFKLGQPEFSHHYPTPPSITASAAVGVAPTPIPPSNDILQITITDLNTLAQALPPEAIIGVGSTYHLIEPILVSNGGKIIVTGGGRLILDRGSYIEVGPGGIVKLSNVTIRATGSTSNRGFLADVGGLMVLHHDRLLGLGRIASLARGVTFIAAQPGSGIFDTVIRDGAYGVFATLTPGIVVVRNIIVGSRQTGIEIQGRETAPLVNSNRVVDSAFDGISLSGGTASTNVQGNTVVNSGRYGILINASPGPLTLTSNTVSGSFDGVVFDNAAGTTLRRNTIDGAQRFGVRLSGSTTGVTIDSNLIRNSAVGLYASQGPHGNLIVHNTFDANGENVRLRLSAPHNFVIPPPRRSELKSP